MKIRSMIHNNHKKITRAFVDKELGGEGCTFVLASGKEGTHGEQVLEYNQDPQYLRDALLYKLTLEAKKRVETSTLSKQEIIRRLGTSAAQLYRLLDQTNYSKSVDATPGIPFEAGLSWRKYCLTSAPTELKAGRAYS